MHPNIIGLGTASMDIVLNCDALPREDGFAWVHQERMTPGGSCANVLTVLARFGHAPALIAKLGEDQCASVFISDLKKNNIRTDYLLENPGGTTLHTYITVAEDGRKSIFANLGDSQLELKEEEVHVEWLRDVSVFYTDLFPARPALKLARACVKRGIRVVFNLQTSVSFMKMCGVSQDQIREMIGLSDVFITSREGMQAIDSGRDPLAAARNICRACHAKNGVIVTLGEEGVFWAGEEFSMSSPVFRVEPVDTTGAGDAFAGGLIHSFLLERRTRGDSLTFAQACAAVKCTLPGPRFYADPAAVTDLFLQRRKGNTAPA